MSEVHRNISQRRGRPPGTAAIAEKLQTDVAWVERCMQAYGRVPANRFRTSDVTRERLEEAIEEGKPLHPRPDAPDVQPAPRREREKRRGARIEPTPDPFLEEFGVVRER